MSSLWEKRAQRSRVHSTQLWVQRESSRLIEERVLKYCEQQGNKSTTQWLQVLALPNQRRSMTTFHSSSKASKSWLLNQSPVTWKQKSLARSQLLEETINKWPRSLEILSNVGLRWMPAATTLTQPQGRTSQDLVAQLQKLTSTQMNFLT